MTEASKIKIVYFIVFLFMLAMGTSFYMIHRENNHRIADERKKVFQAASCVERQIGRIERGDFLITDRDPLGKEWMVVDTIGPDTSTARPERMGVVLSRNSLSGSSSRELSYESLCNKVAEYKLIKRHSPEAKDLFLRWGGF